MNNLTGSNFLNQPESGNLSKLKGIDLVYYLGTRCYLLEKNGEPKGFVNRFDFLKIIGLKDVRSSYNVLERLEKSGFAEVVPSGRKGIWINLILADSPNQRIIVRKRRVIKIRPGEKITIQAEGV